MQMATINLRAPTANNKGIWIINQPFSNLVIVLVLCFRRCFETWRFIAYWHMWTATQLPCAPHISVCLSLSVRLILCYSVSLSLSPRLFATLSVCLCLSVSVCVCLSPSSVVIALHTSAYLNESNPHCMNQVVFTETSLWYFAHQSIPAGRISVKQLFYYWKRRG